MRPGESITCPRCGERTVVKSRKKMDGFTVVGEVYVCILCGAEIGSPEDASASAPPDHAAADRFAALLGDVAAPAAKADLTPDADYGRFCRNCELFIEHPFRTICGHDGRTADPMGECGHFQKKLGK